MHFLEFDPIVVRTLDLYVHVMALQVYTGLRKYSKMQFLRTAAEVHVLYG